MLYKKIYVVALPIYAFLTSNVCGSDYYVSSDPNADYRCESGLTSCHIYCDVGEHENINAYDCDDADDCYFHCDEKKCAASAILDATNANTLHVDMKDTGEECFNSANITTPNNGSAYFTTLSKKSFKALTIIAGSNAHEIIIDISNGKTGIGSSISDFKIYAATADYLQLIIGNNLEWKDSILQCPVNSPYNGPDVAPCMIDAVDGKVNTVNIIAPDGYPKNVYFDGCSTCSAVQITCSNVDTLNDDQSDTSSYPFDTSSDCWWTPNPTMNPLISNHPSTQPTMPPTNQPTIPTHVPSSAPSTIPSSTPSNIPSVSPSNFPTMDPTIDPTNMPTMNPTNIPSMDPTNMPSFYPSRVPSSDTVHPSAVPSTNPSNDPTHYPTATPSVPTKAPSKKRLVANDADPTHHPTKPPTQTLDIFTSDPEEEYLNQISGDIVTTSLYIIIGVLMIGLLCMIAVFIVYRKRWMNEKKDDKSSNDIQEKMVELKAPDSVRVRSVSRSDVDNTADVPPPPPPLPDNSANYLPDNPTSYPPPPLRVTPMAVEIHLPSNPTVRQDDENVNEDISESTLDSDDIIGGVDGEGKTKDIPVHIVHNSVHNDDPNQKKIHLLKMAMSHMQQIDAEIERKEPNQHDKFLQIMAKKKEEIEKVKVWMENVVNLAEYTELLIMNGYDDMESLTEITLEDLKDIGISKVGHRRKLLKYAERYSTMTTLQ